MYVSIPSSYILAEHEKLRRELDNDQVRKFYENKEDQQKIREEALANEYKVCDGDTGIKIRERLDNLDGQLLKNDISNQFYNAEVMRAAACTIESIIKAPPSEIGSLYHNELLRKYITHLKQIGAESANGYALLGDFGKIKGMFVEKVSRDPNNDDLLHELIVGLYGTNKARNYIPNFAYIYGGFKCSPPVIDPETKQLTSWCLDNTNAVNYILYENVAPAVSMKEYLESCTPQDFLNIYMQVLYSLRLGHKLFDFTHYDLHHENILIRDYKIHHQNRVFQILYETENGNEYLTANKIATFIDVGYSHIQHNNNHFGIYGLIPYFTYPDRSWIMHDAYKFLLFCMEDGLQYNRGVFNEAAKIFKYFNQVEDPVTAIEAQIPLNYSFPLTEETAGLNLDDLARHIRAVCDCSFINARLSSDPVLECEGVCVEEREILRQIGVDPNGQIMVPTEILDLFDLISLLQNDNNKTDEERIIEQFNYQTAMRSYLEMVDAKVKELNNLVSDLEARLAALSAANIDLTNYDQMNDIRSGYALIAKIVDTFFEIAHYREVGVQVADWYSDIDAVNQLDDTIPASHEIADQVLTDALAVLEENEQIFNDISEEQERQIVEQTGDKRLRWYWRGRQSFDDHYIQLIINILG